MNILNIIGYVLALCVGGLIGFFGYKKTLTEKALQFKARMAKAKEIEEEMIETAQKKVEKIIENAEVKAQKIEDQRIQKIELIENKLLAREEKMDEKLEKLEEEKKNLITQQEKIATLVEDQRKKLEQVSGLSREEAKTQLLAEVEVEYQKDMTQFVEKMKTITKEEADKEAVEILVRALPRVAAESVTEYTTIMVDLPNEEFKGKLIGREGRNISYFEKMTGVELIVDDTPLVVRLSSFDSEKRFIGTRTLERLVKDGRINPFYIEKTYKEVVHEFDDLLMEKGKEALAILNLPMMKPDIVKYIGQFFLRFSYGQNLWAHSIEVAKICEGIATEMGLDPLMAKKAGLLHDIGKVIATTSQSHTQIGGEVLRKYAMDPVIVNAAESHHYDVPMTDPISWVVTAADAISASRPGARFNTKDLFLDKMGELEKLISGIEGVDKVHIMQAGREIMVYVDPQEVNDMQLEKLLKTIAEKIESQLDYPGIIRVTAIRESRLIEYLR